MVQIEKQGAVHSVRQKKDSKTKIESSQANPCGLFVFVFIPVKSIFYNVVNCSRKANAIRRSYVRCVCIAVVFPVRISNVGRSWVGLLSF